jgi:hypothetical protein
VIHSALGKHLALEIHSALGIHSVLDTHSAGIHSVPEIQ